MLVFIGRQLFTASEKVIAIETIDLSIVYRQNLLYRPADMVID